MKYVGRMEGVDAVLQASLCFSREDITITKLILQDEKRIANEQKKDIKRQQ